MKIALNVNQFFDDVGRPLVEGRVSIYKHDSDIFNEIYTLVGDDYAPATNPMILSNDGRMPTVFFEAGIVDVKVEKLVGDGIYELVGTFEAGFDMPQSKNDSFVYGMHALAEVSPDLGIVTVVGYYSDYDAPARSYVWDPYCSDVADGGIVVESNTGNEGRWILLWEDEMLPSSVYGIKPGVNEANISAFIGYADYVGSYQIRTPKIPRFLGGTYTGPGSYVTTKTLYFDKGAQFVSAGIQCPRAIIPEWDNYVADFYITAKDATVHSGWFKTMAYFLTCDADNMVFDKDNYFLTTIVNVPYNLVGKVIEAHGRLPATYANNGRIVFDKCSFVGTQFFSSTDFVAFAHTEFRQDWFSTAYNAWDFVSKVLVRSTSMNKLLLANFTDVRVYVKAMEADGATEIDLAGRKVGTLATSASISTVRNAVCDSLTITRPYDNVSLDNVTCSSLSVSCIALNITNSSVSFANDPVCTGITCIDSDIASYAPITDPTIAISMQRCRLTASIDRATDNATKDSAIVLRDCLLDSVTIKSKSLAMQGCTVNNSWVQVYPYYANSAYHIDLTLQGNLFNSMTPVTITKVAQDDCYECIANWVIMGNTFMGNAEGIRCRYWSNRTGSYFETLFIVNDNRSSIVYSGNSGLCPSESMKGSTLPVSTAPWQTVDVGGGQNAYIYTYTASRCCPKYTRSEDSTGVQKLYMVDAQSAATSVSVDHDNALAMSVRNGVYFWQTAGALADQDGDFFQLGFALWINDLGADKSILMV